MGRTLLEASAWVPFGTGIGCAGEFGSCEVTVDGACGGGVAGEGVAGWRLPCGCVARGDTVVGVTFAAAHLGASRASAGIA